MLWGITGCSGSGASTVSGVWEAMGASVCRLDTIGHRALERKRVRNALAGALGIPALVETDSRGVRRMLRERAFKDPEILAGVNQVLHPVLIRWAGYSAARIRDAEGIFVLDAALLFELGLEGHVDFTVTVMDTPERCVERLVKRDGIKRSTAAGRLGSQMDILEKCRRSHFILSNTADLAALHKKSEIFYNKVILTMEEN